MADGVSIAERAEDPDATWDCCECCSAHRRLDDLGMCHVCATDPLKRELVTLRRSADDHRGALAKRNQELDAALRDLAHLREIHRRSVRKARDFRRAMVEKATVLEAYFALPLTEGEHDALVAIMIDARDDEPTIPILAICRKLDI